ncbi:MAG: hypothetical protein II517_04190 [Ruminococcus sp.]|nr:hypothetical protein [Ruminococcus sp.]MBQ2487520.1 hypothetical protein [Ruminococcus sp.]
MAIQTERLTINGREFVRTYSDEGRYVVGGVPHGEYTEASDPAEFVRTYAEGNLIPLDEGGESADAHALTRYINEQMGAGNPDLVSAAETLIKNTITEA